MSVNLNTNREQILSAWKDVLNTKSDTDWALFGYEGQTNDLKVVGVGDGGLDELREEFNSGKIQYAFCRVPVEAAEGKDAASLYKFVLINWQGEGAPSSRKGACTGHLRDVAALLHGHHVTMAARTEDDVEESVVIETVKKASVTFVRTISARNDPEEIQKVGTAYKKVNPTSEIDAEARNQFWAKEEAEETSRRQLQRDEERQKKKAAEEAWKKERQESREQIRDKPTGIPQQVSSHRNEAKQLAGQRAVGSARAVFERNTSVGQLLANQVVTNSQEKENGTSCEQEAKAELHTTTHGTTNGEQHNSADIASPPVVTEQLPTEELQEQTEIKTVDDDILLPGSALSARALYDYQAADDTEISFEPGEVITHVDPIDEGWWQGLAPDGTKYGLFPANYVELIP